MLTITAMLDDGRTLFVLGLTHGDLERLAGGPIRAFSIERETHGLSVPAGIRIALVAGEDDAALEAELRRRGILGPDTVYNQQRAM